VLRPANLNVYAPGLGSRTYAVGDEKIAVAVLLGQSAFTRLHGDNPYVRLPELLERLRRETPYILIDFHASTTAEKLSLFATVDGACSAAIGSHGRVQTSDDRVMPKGTAVICDAGRTGSQVSVGGTAPQIRIQEYRSGIPDWSKDAWEKPELQGVLVDINANGKAASIERIRIPCPEVAQHEGNGKDPEDPGEEDNG
jgi:calcineurin-like phosphoesterase